MRHNLIIMRNIEITEGINSLLAKAKWNKADIKTAMSFLDHLLPAVDQKSVFRNFFKRTEFQSNSALKKKKNKFCTSLMKVYGIDLTASAN